MAKKTPRHLRSLPPHVAESLSPEASRVVADTQTALERKRRERDAKGWANTAEGVPPFLASAEAEAPRAADLWRAMRPGSSLSDVLILCRQRFGMGPDATRATLDALQRAELVTRGPDGFTTVGPRL